MPVSQSIRGRTSCKWFPKRMNVTQGRSKHVNTAGRVAGICLVSLGLACWPGKTLTRAALFSMPGYSLLVTACLLYLGIRGELVGPLLWPAVVLHAVLTWRLGHGLFRKNSAVMNKPEDEHGGR